MTSPASFVALDEMVCRKDHDAVISVFEAQSVDFNNYVETVAAFETESVAEAAFKPSSIQEKTVFDSMPVGRDQVGNILSPVSNTLDPVSLPDALFNDAVASIMKISIGSTTADPPDELDNLWEMNRGT